MSKTSTSPQVCPGAAAPEDIRDYQTKHRAGGKALSSIMKPIREYVLIARILVIAVSYTHLTLPTKRIV